MIEEIKKEILEKTDSDVYDTLIVQYDDVIEILDKYNNQPDYKTKILEDVILTDVKIEQSLRKKLYLIENYKLAWEELINLYENTLKDTRSKNDIMLLGQLKELSKKYNLDSIVERVDEE